MTIFASLLLGTVQLEVAVEKCVRSTRILPLFIELLML